MLREPWMRLCALFGLLGAAAALYAGPSALLMVPLAAVLGPIVGFTSTAPYFTATFRALLLAGLSAAAIAMLLGLRHRRRVWGQLLVVVGAGLWITLALVGFGPQ